VELALPFVIPGQIFCEITPSKLRQGQPGSARDAESFQAQNRDSRESSGGECDKEKDSTHADTPSWLPLRFAQE
jgi:hypothetical protein